MEKLKVLQKLQLARQLIADMKMKKSGQNTYSKYKYFTPEQIQDAAFKASTEAGLIDRFILEKLEKEESGAKGKLIITCLESGAEVVFEMPTAFPEIKATNIVQQIGGCMTYTERYLKMTAYGIADNSLDPDTSENTKKEVEKPKNPIKPSLDEKHPKWNAVCDRIKAGANIDDVKKHYYLTTEIETKLKNL